MHDENRDARLPCGQNSYTMTARMIKRFRHSPRLLYCGGWMLAGAYNFGRDVFYAPWYPLLVSNLAYFSVWMVLGLVSLALLRHFPLDRRWPHWLLHFAAAVVLTQIDVTIGTGILLAFFNQLGGMTLADVAMEAFKSCFHLGLLHYFFFIGIVEALRLVRYGEAQRLKAAEHKAALVRAELQSLKAQLQPHFLFNTLNDIASLMHYDVDTADRMLNRLSDLLRMSLKEARHAVVPLKEELAFIEAYLEIEKIRFEERLDVEWSVPQDLQASTVPSFILQPLVENAIKYGVAPRAGGGSIVIRAYVERDALLLEVEDDAPDSVPQQPGFGVGLSNIRSRLEALYGAEQRVELIRAGLRTTARIRLPLEVTA
jgi:signal transduction histidine kinase